METLVIQTVRDLLGLLEVPFSNITKETIAGQEVFTIQAEDARTLIGPHGDTIYALDMIVKKIVEKKLATEVHDIHFLIDVNGYRAQKIRDLEQKAKMMADRARSFQYDVELEPMSAYERLIVHTVLQGEEHITTESQGEGRGRRIVIKYAA